MELKNHELHQVPQCPESGKEAVSFTSAKIMNYTRFLNAQSLARKPSPIRVLTALLARSPPTMISLAGGIPNPELFPFESAEFQLKDGGKLTLDKSKMNTALQYGSTQGQANLLSLLKSFQKDIHAPPTLDRSPEEGGLELCVTVGSQDGICKAFEMMVEAGDNVVIENPTYPATLAILNPLSCNLIGVETDGHGMVPDSFEQVMSHWKPSDAQDPKSDIPKVLYTIPNGGNPTGVSLTLDRKQRIYEIARRYNMVILEDDPYYFLQFQKPVPSYLSLDKDGRVMRFDSFSKIISSGLRIGFVSGPQPLVDGLIKHMQVSVLHTPALPQVLLFEVLQRWGISGFKEHVQKVTDFYSSQKEKMVAASTKHLSGLAEWNDPSGGMFLWIKLLHVPDTKKLIEEKALKKEVLLVPGCAFMVDSEAPSPYLRASFSLASESQMNQGLERLASLIREELEEKS